jgi:Putative transposase
MRLHPHEFIRRFLMHVLPKGFHRIRHYGLFANANRAENIATARALLNVAPPAADPEEPPDIATDTPRVLPCPCPFQMRWPHAGSDLTRPGRHSRCTARSLMIRSKRLPRCPLHPSNLARVQTQRPNPVRPVALQVCYLLGTPSWQRHMPWNVSIKPELLLPKASDRKTLRLDRGVRSIQPLSPLDASHPSKLRSCALYQNGCCQISARWL